MEKEICLGNIQFFPGEKYFKRAKLNGRVNMWETYNFKIQFYFYRNTCVLLMKSKKKISIKN